MMNTKVKTSSTSAVGRGSVGRPVGVVPLALKPVLPVECHSGTGIKPRRIKRTPSTGSITSINSVRSCKSDITDKSGKQAGCHRQRNGDDNDGDDSGQDVKFFNVESRPSTGNSTFSTNVGDQPPTLPWQEILNLSQESDPYKVYEVVLHGEYLKRVPDLEKFRKLRVLDISGNKIKKINGLDFNKDLRELKLYDNNLSSIENLDNLKELSSLQLQHNRISKLGPGLGALKKLSVVRLDNNKLTKLETPELVSCSNIRTLDVSYNRLESLSALNYLPNLEELRAAGNLLRTCGTLTKCKRLQDIDLSHNLLTDLNGISNLPSLKIVNVSHNQFQSVKSVGKLKCLEELNVSSNHLSSLRHMIQAFPKLQILNVCDNKIVSWNEICALSNLVELVELFANGNPFTLEEGEMPTYHLHVQHELPQLEVIDGIHITRKTSKHGCGPAPVMRPMSAASVISVKQVDAQLENVAKEQETLHRDIRERFDSLRALFDTLPSELNVPTQTIQNQSEGQSRCSSRARLREAQQFAATNFDDDEDEF